jgi:putative Mg2+ transporter-C (MgtC) family protein
MSEWDIVARMFVALVAGGLIGLERQYRGRAAGLRTYALVSFGSATLLAATQYILFAPTHGESDPTRVIQGIVTGIGFLGAGVIVKEGFSVRGLTTAASIWVASAIGIVIGSGLYIAGTAAAGLTLVALAGLRHIEDRLHVQYIVHCVIAFPRARMLDEAWLRDLMKRKGFVITELSYRLDAKADLFEYRSVMWSLNPQGIGELERSLRDQPEVVSFKVSPSRD